jgi:hypothetical protein
MLRRRPKRHATKTKRLVAIGVQLPVMRCNGLRAQQTQHKDPSIRTIISKAPAPILAG